MGLYAEGTSVPVHKSRAEIEGTVMKYGATKFASALEEHRAMVMFEAQARRVMFELPLPPKSDFETRLKNTGYGRTRKVSCSPEQREALWEQACRQRWRALALVIKAKLEAVASGITTFEDEFLAHIVLPDGKTVGKWFKPQLAAAYSKGEMPPMLPSGES